MPELPEVETTRRGLSPLLENKTVTGVLIRDHRLRQPVQEDLERRLIGQRLNGIKRRAKYLLFSFDSGTLIVHLGMSGNLRVAIPETPLKKHDHVELVFNDGRSLRFHDPRRFGLMVWSEKPVDAHPLLRHLGPEPWDADFTADYLRRLASGRTAPVKNFIMDSRVVVGVGNIYASESLFRAGIHPGRAAGRISCRRYEKVVSEIRSVLEEALEVGGTTLRDFLNSDGQPGYFRLQLKVYGRTGEPCECGKALIRQRTIGQRSSFYCARCQH